MLPFEYDTNYTVSENIVNNYFLSIVVAKLWAYYKGTFSYVNKIIFKIIVALFFGLWDNIPMLRKR